MSDFRKNMLELFSSPFIEERLYLIWGVDIITLQGKFSSPFIEERLYLENFKNVFVVSFSALLSWSNIDQNNGLDWPTGRLKKFNCYFLSIAKIQVKSYLKYRK